MVVAAKQTASDAAAFWSDWSNRHPFITQGVKGAFKTGLGGLSIAGGATACGTLVGCVVGGPVAAFGASELTQGITMIWGAVHGVSSEG